MGPNDLVASAKTMAWTCFVEAAVADSAHPAGGGQVGYASRWAWTGWVACPGSLRNRRPRIAAPNPQLHIGDSFRFAPMAQKD